MAVYLVILWQTKFFDGQNFTMAKSKHKIRIPTESEIPELLKKKWIQPQINDGRIQHNYDCEVCQSRTSISNEILKCVYCNVVCHKSCAQQYYRKSQITSPKMWICFFCVDYLDDSRARFERERREVTGFERNIQAQTIIAKYWRRYVCRNFYIRVYTIVVKLQIMYHVRHRKRDFMLSLQEKLRPVKLKIIKCHNLVVTDRDTNKKRPAGFASPSKEKALINREYHFYFIITVVDFNNGEFNQTWRVNSSTYFTNKGPDEPFDLRCDEKIMIGGVSGFHNIVITCFQQGSGRDYVVGQVHVQLSKDFLWRRGGRFHMDFGATEFTIKDYGGMEMKADYRLAPQGSIEFELTTYHGMNFECGYCSGTSLEDMIRMLYRLPPYSGYIVEQQSNNRQSKKAEMSAASGSSNSYSFPLKRMWIAIAEGRLYAFSHFGDQLKLSFLLADFTPAYEFRDDHVVFKLQRNGYPDFSFYPVAVGDSLRWKCALLASLRYNAVLAAAATAASVAGKIAVAEDGTGGTIINLTQSSTTSGTRGFDMKLLVDDLLAMEARLMLQKGYRQHLPEVNGVKGVSAYTKQHANRFGSTDFSAIQQVIEASHALTNQPGHLKRSVTNTSINKTPSPQKSSKRNDSRFAFDVEQQQKASLQQILHESTSLPSISQNSSPVKQGLQFQSQPSDLLDLPQHGRLLLDKLTQHHPATTEKDKRNSNGPNRGGLNGSGSGRGSGRKEKGGRRVTDAALIAELPPEVRDQISSKVIEASQIDDLVDDSRYQILGESFVETMLTSVARAKLKGSGAGHRHHPLHPQRAPAKLPPLKNYDVQET